VTGKGDSTDSRLFSTRWPVTEGAGDAPTGLPAERLRPSNFALNNGGCPNSFQISRAVDRQIIPWHNRLWDTVL
jgi:hypothetical protein